MELLNSFWLKMAIGSIFSPFFHFLETFKEKVIFCNFSWFSEKLWRKFFFEKYHPEIEIYVGHQYYMIKLNIQFLLPPVNFSEAHKKRNFNKKWNFLRTSEKLTMEIKNEIWSLIVWNLMSYINCDFWRGAVSWKKIAFFENLWKMGIYWKNTAYGNFGSKWV